MVDDSFHPDAAVKIPYTLHWAGHGAFQFLSNTSNDLRHALAGMDLR